MGRGVTPETRTARDPAAEFVGKRPRCTHCGRRVARNTRSAILHADGTRSEYCAHRRACRRAEHDSIADQGPLRLPYEIRDLATESAGAALIAADYITLPWWLRLVPQRVLDRLWRDAAVQIGGAVQASVLHRGERAGR
jgi:hypothetical protein